MCISRYGGEILITSHIPTKCLIQCKKSTLRGLLLKDYIEERAVSIANYIIDNNATVRQTAKEFGVSKSTVHVEVTI